MLAGYRAKRAIQTLISSATRDAPEAVAARATLTEIGPAAVPQLIEALDSTSDTRPIEELLAALATGESISHLSDALFNGNERTAASVARALIEARIDPSHLLDLFETPGAPEALTTRIIEGHRDRLEPEAILERIDAADSYSREALFRLLRRLAHEAQIPGILRRMNSPDAALRLQLVRTLGLFGTAESRRGLVERLRDDPHRDPRLAALDALLAQEGSAPVELLCELLADDEMIIRNQAIEALVRLNRVETLPLVTKLLRTGTDDVRRAAVEVLNEVGTGEAIPDLIAALADRDWWVRARSGDALARTEAPALLDGILPLVAGVDEDRRAQAIDVLKRCRDPQLPNLLLRELDGATAEVDHGRHLAVIRVLGELGDSRAIPALVAQVHSTDEALRGEALRSLESLADGPQADQVLSAVNEVVDQAGDEGLRRASLAAVTKLSRKIRDRESIAPRLSALARGIGDEVLQMGTRLESSADPSSRPGSAAFDPLSLQPGDFLAHRYRILRQVGRGGFGVVVLAVDEMVRDEIILKFLAAHVAGDSSAVERFKHELRYARKITHENVIRIYDIISFGTSLGISMEYFPSHSLATEIGRQPSKSERRWIGLLRQICAGLAEAHRAKVVHRDLKPGNVLINNEDQVKIVDFGLSAAANPGASRLTRSGLVIGTPTYMSPEQIRGGALDGRSDIYSLGVLMYELFTGRPPYAGPDPMAILFQHLEGNAPPPRQQNSDLSPEIESVIQRAMAVDPKNRFPSAMALSEELGRLPELRAS